MKIGLFYLKPEHSGTVRAIPGISKNTGIRVFHGRAIKNTVIELKSRKIKVGSSQVHYLCGGQGEPLIVVHGGGGGALTWLKTAQRLAGKYRVYVPDLPGFGESDAPQHSCGAADFVSFIEGFSSHLGIDRFHLMGHSFGGGIALNYALAFPHRVMRLVLVSSIGLGKDIALWVRIFSTPPFCISLGTVAMFLQKLVGKAARIIHVPFKILNPLTRAKMNVGLSMTTLNGQTTVLLDRISELVMPVMLIWGAGDNIVPVRHAYNAAELIPDSRVHVFDGCGHSVYRQRYREFSDVLDTFL